METKSIKRKKNYFTCKARGMKCPRCGNFMYAQEEIPEGGKYRVYYVCRSCNYATTVWE